MGMETHGVFGKLGNTTRVCFDCLFALSSLYKVNIKDITDIIAIFFNYANYRFAIFASNKNIFNC